VFYGMQIGYKKDNAISESFFNFVRWMFTINRFDPTI
jgi:hypothetical protein